MNKKSLSEKMRLPSTPEARKNRRDHLAPVVLGLGTAAAILTIAIPKVIGITEDGANTLNNAIDAIGERIHGPTFSDGLMVETATKDETVWDIAREVNDPLQHASLAEVRRYIMHMPENKQTFQDGQLSEGETVFYPNHVK